MTKAELAALRAQAAEDSAMIPMPSKAQLRELLSVYDAARAFKICLDAIVEPADE